MPVRPPPTSGPRIDWSRIIFDLERCGMSQRDIGRECDVEESSAGSWANRLKNIPGTQPKFHHGAMLLGLWATKTNSAPALAPRETV